MTVQTANTRARATELVAAIFFVLGVILMILVVNYPINRHICPDVPKIITTTPLTEAERQTSNE
jgi:hypothetical protein